MCSYNKIIGLVIIYSMPTQKNTKNNRSFRLPSRKSPRGGLSVGSGLYIDLDDITDEVFAGGIILDLRRR